MDANKPLPDSDESAVALPTSDSSYPLQGITANEEHTFKGSDGISRVVTYLRLEGKLLTIDVPTHTFVVAGNLNVFWYDDSFLESHPDAPTGSMAADGGAYPKTYDLLDDGLNIPINPTLPFSSMEDFTLTAPTKVLFDPKTSLVYYTLSYRARLSARLGLQRFPFDRFKLQIRVNIRSSQYHLSPAPFAGVPDRWGLRKPLNIWLSQPVADEYTPREGHACVWDCSKWKPVATLFLQRHPDHYLTNALLPLSLIVLISAAIHVIPPDDLSNRMEIAIALLLTQFALKFALSSGVPVVPYRTLMDGYYIVSTLVIFTNLVIAICVALWFQSEEDTKLDRILTSAMGLTWTLANVLILCNVHRLYPSWDDLHGQQQNSSMDLARVMAEPVDLSRFGQPVDLLRVPENLVDIGGAEKPLSFSV